MKLTVLLIGVLLGLNLSFGQATSGTNKVLQAKIQFFNQKLALSPAEAKEFWPIYNDYQSRRSKLSKERKNIMGYYSENSTNMSNDEISETLSRYIEIEKEETKLLDTYNEKFKQVLSDEKVLKIYIVEIQFKNHLLKQLRTGKQEMKLRK